jgi:hypothetical protein
MCVILRNHSSRMDVAWLLLLGHVMAKRGLAAQRSTTCGMCDALQ